MLLKPQRRLFGVPIDLLAGLICGWDPRHGANGYLRGGQRIPASPYSSDSGGKNWLDRRGNGLLKNAPQNFMPGNGLFEQERTNRLIHNRAMENAVWTKRGTSVVTDNTSEIKDPRGTNTATRIDNIGEASLNDIFQNVTGFTNDATLAPSFWMQAITTSGTILLNSPQGPTFGSWTIDLTKVSSSKMERIVKEHPAVTENNAWVASATGAGGLLFKAGSGGDKDLYYWAGQLEEGEFSTSEILTTTAAVTRAADVLRYDVSWDQATTQNLTIIAVVSIEGQPSAPAYFCHLTQAISAIGKFYLVYRDIGSGNQQLQFISSNDANSSNALNVNKNLIVSQRYVIGGTYTEASVKGYLDGALLGEATTAGKMPTITMKHIMVGVNWGTAFQPNAAMQRLLIFRRVKTPDEIRHISDALKADTLATVL